MHWPEVPQLLDLYHAAQHLYTTADALWPQKAAGWWHRRLQQLQQGELTNFFRALRRLAGGYGDRGAEHSPRRLLQYFLGHQQRLGYRWAILSKLPIASSMLESAARHIVQQRLKQSGMRWSGVGAQSILNLQTLHRNGQFEQCWENFAATA